LSALLGRETPGLPPEVLFSDLEIKVLKAYAGKNLNPPDCLGDMVKLVANIGGYLLALKRSTSWSPINVARLYTFTADV